MKATSTGGRIVAAVAALLAAVGAGAVSTASPAQAVAVTCTRWVEIPSDGDAPGPFPTAYSRACVERTHEGRYWASLAVRTVYGDNLDDRVTTEFLKVNARVELHYCDGGAISATGYYDDPPSVRNASEMVLGTNDTPGSSRGFRVNYRVKSIYYVEGGYASAGGGTAGTSTCR